MAYIHNGAAPDVRFMHKWHDAKHRNDEGWKSSGRSTRADIGSGDGRIAYCGKVLGLNVYGIEIDDVYIIGVNVAAMFLTMTVLIMKLKYEKAFESIRK